MLLTFDIGNTNIVIGIFDQKKLIKKWRLVSNTKKSADDYAVDIIELCLIEKVDCLKISGAIIASVVPTLTGLIHEAVKKITSETFAGNGSGKKRKGKSGKIIIHFWKK